MKSLLWTIFFVITKVGVYAPPFPTVLYILLAYRFRAYARSVVYNYVLQNDKREWLKRLWERHPLRITPEATRGSYDGWALSDVHQVLLLNGEMIEQWIEYRKVNKLQFYLVVFFLWGWLDDDSNEDTTDKGHIQRLLDQPGRWDICGRLVRRWCKPVETVYGNSFDLGDVRAEHPYFQWANTFVWNCRNTSMNFKYLWMDY